MTRKRREARGGRRRQTALGTLLAGLAAVAPLAAAGGAPCASPGWLASAPAKPASAAGPAALGERLTVRFDGACRQPFVLELELRLHVAGQRDPVARRSAPREFRPGERFLPGESYLVSRAFPESGELLAALFERARCGAHRVAGSRTLAASDPDPDPGALGVACVLVVGAPEATTRDAAPSAGARLALLLAGDPE